MNKQTKIETSKEGTIRAAVYTRVSTDEGLDMEFNSLDAQREACEAYVVSQRHEGWELVEARYDDGGFSGGTMKRPALGRLLDDVRAGSVDTIVVYKIDRLTRSLADFSRIVDILDAQGASFISVTQAFSTTTSMGRLTLNVLLSFAQFEREVGAERVRDKIASSKKKGIWMGGVVPLGYDARNRKLIVNEAEADTVRRIFDLYLELKSVVLLVEQLRQLDIRSKHYVGRSGREHGGNQFSRGALYTLLRNVIYVGDSAHKGERYPGRHDAIIDTEIFDRVQRSLADNRVKRRHRADAARPSLLAGILHDERGDRMTPSHTTRKSRRFRYYVSRQGRGPSRFRVPAREIERAVMKMLDDFLGDRQAVLDELGQQRDAAAIEAMLDRTERLAGALVRGRNVKRREAMLEVVDRITLTPTDLSIALSSSRLAVRLLGEETGEDLSTITLQQECRLVRRSNEVRLVIAPKDEGPRVDPALVKLVVKGHTAREALMASEGRSLPEVAKGLGHDPHYFSVLVKLGYLAPDLIEEIIEGRHQVRLDRQRLARIRNLPMTWQGQRKLFDQYR